MSASQRAFWALVAATTAVYAAMLLWTGPIIITGAGGQMPFDVRMGGYSLDESRAFLTALTPTGTATYLGPAGWLDSFFPGMFTLVLIWSFWSLLQNHPWGFRTAAIAVAAVYGILDYLENSLVRIMLTTSPEQLDASLVSKASHATVLKFVFVGIAILCIITLLIARYRARRKKAGNT